MPLHRGLIQPKASNREKPKLYSFPLSPPLLKPRKPLSQDTEEVAIWQKYSPNQASYSTPAPPRAFVSSLLPECTQPHQVTAVLFTEEKTGQKRASDLPEVTQLQQNLRLFQVQNPGLCVLSDTCLLSVPDGTRRKETFKTECALGL